MTVQPPPPSPEERVELPPPVEEERVEVRGTWGAMLPWAVVLAVLAAVAVVLLP